MTTMATILEVRGRDWKGWDQCLGQCEHKRLLLQWNDSVLNSRVGTMNTAARLSAAHSVVVVEGVGRGGGTHSAHVGDHSRFVVVPGPPSDSVRDSEARV